MGFKKKYQTKHSILGKDVLQVKSKKKKCKVIPVTMK
jgi:hypothetical protein